MTAPIAVVGMACRFPGADDVDEYWDLIRTGQVATGPVSTERWRHAHLHTPDDQRAPDSTYTDVVAHLRTVDRFAAQRYALPPRMVEVTDPQHRLLVTLTDLALRDAALRDLPRERSGVYVGASVSEYKDLLTSRIRALQMAAGEFGTALDAETARSAVRGVAPVRAYTIAGTLLNMAAATVSSVFDLGGPSFVTDAACSSALVALHEAVVHLRAGQCDAAVVGGVYLNLVPDNLIGFARVGALSRSGVCRPFDRRADGFVVGEGAAVVVLKRLDDALRDGDRVHAVVLGTGCANDGRADGPMTPRQSGQVAALRRAYTDAGVDPATVGFVECHGTATPTGDLVEVAALREVFGPDAAPHVSSVKANIGHTMPAAGIAGLVKALLVLRHATIPPQVGCAQPDPALGSLRVASRDEPWPSPLDGVRRAGVSSFGFGGTNVHVVLEEAPGAPASVRPRPVVEAAGERYWAIMQGADPGHAKAAPPALAEVDASPGASPAVASPLLESLAAVSAYPIESFRPDQALMDDLGFDSLMLVELEEQLSRRYAGLDALPSELLQRTTTIAAVGAWLTEHGAAPEPPAAPSPASPAPPPVPPVLPVESDGLPRQRAALPELAALAERLDLAQQLGLPNPYFVVHETALRDVTTVGDHELVDFSGYDYLGLATDPVVVDSAQRAIRRHGTSVSASRLASGERPAHRELEAAIAGLLGADAALAMVSGHATNVSVLGHLLRPGDLALHDALAHDSILQGIRLSGAVRRPFPHNDLGALDRLLADLAGHHRRVLVAVEGVYSMDGDLVDLPALVELRRRHGFLLYLDEAHSLGVLGETGRGAGEHWGVRPGDVDIWMGTLSKALASCGGYVAGAADLIEYLRYTTPGFVYSVGLPPASTAAALAAIRQLVAEPERVARLRDNANLFRRLAAEHGIDTGPGGSAVVPVVTGTSVSALRVADRMRRRGVNVQPIVYPAVEEGAARLRFFVNATHSAEQIRSTVTALAEELAQDRSGTAVRRWP